MTVTGMPSTTNCSGEMLMRSPVARPSEMSAVWSDNLKIETLIDTLCEDDKTHPVICSDTGELLGEIDRTIVMKSMKS